MSTRKTGWLRAAAGLAAIALAAAACGGGTTAGTTVDAGDTTPAAAAQTSVTTAPTTAVTSTGAGPAEAPLTFLVAALEKSSSRAVRGSMQTSVGAMGDIVVQFEADADGNLSLAWSFNEAMSAGVSGLGVETRFVDGNVYAQFVVPEGAPSFVRETMPAGWFTADANSAAELGAVCPSTRPGAAPDDGTCLSPTDHSWLIQHMVSAELVGQADIDGEATTHLRGTLDLAAASEGLFDGNDSGDGVDVFDEDIFPEELVYDLWVDADHLLRRVSFDMGALLGDFLESLSADEPGAEPEELAGLLGAAVTVDFHDYDTGMVIEAPPQDAIVGDIGDVMGAVGGEDSGEGSTQGRS
ncbi:hypothetical protein [Candidatus Poriferisodalis sp.]|uniref:hypothetical protein n=1 Tax=Candidatus Poriferisodalis sp. TaxID=3101277 RepID=UPI003B02029C